ncbi:50S ribosomal protein L30 [Candidatus Woesearchaeota archaeon]|nr:50S ribosomal protein L30 [Candidatus Woesearchaeota archaeon]
MSNIDDIKKALKEEKAVIGTDRVMKKIKLGKISKVFLTSNVPEEVKEDIDHYSELSKAEVVGLDMPNDELGTICKKPFSISILGILK